MPRLLPQPWALPVQTWSTVSSQGTTEAQAVPQGTTEAQTVLQGTTEAQTVPQGTTEAQAVPQGTTEAQAVPQGRTEAQAVPQRFSFWPGLWHLVGARAPGKASAVIGDCANH